MGLTSVAMRRGDRVFSPAQPPKTRTAALETAKRYDFVHMLHFLLGKSLNGGARFFRQKFHRSS